MLQTPVVTQTNSIIVMTTITQLMIARTRKGPGPRSSVLRAEMRCSRGNEGGPKEWGSYVATGLIVLCSQFFACSNPRVDRCSNLPWDPLVPLKVVGSAASDAHGVGVVRSCVGVASTEDGGLDRARLGTRPTSGVGSAD